MGKLLIMQTTVNKLSPKELEAFASNPSIEWEEKIAKKNIKYYKQVFVETEPFETFNGEK